MIRSLVYAACLACVATAGAFAEEQHWTGKLAREGDTFSIHVYVKEDGADRRGHLNLPDVHLFGVPLIDADAGREGVRLGFGGDSVDFWIEGTIDGDTFTGTYTYVPQNFAATFTLKATDDPRPYATEEVTFANDDVTLAGTVFRPNTPGPHPGIVLIHGSGDNERWWRFGHADFFARQGFVVLAFDKRGNGGSTGNWRLVGFEPLARDGLAGLRLLQSRPDVDPKRVGFWGISQAGWIMPLAASIAPDDVAFIVTTSGATVSVAEEVKFDYIVRLRDAGYPADVIERADHILNLDHRVTMTGEGYDELRELVKAAREEPWWRTFEYSLTPARARAFPRLIEGFDPRSILEEIDTPILWMYGEEDKSVEPSKSIAILNEIMAADPKPWTIKTFPRADHGLRVPPDPNAPFPLRNYAPGHWETIAAWLRENVLAGT